MRTLPMRLAFSVVVLGSLFPTAARADIINTVPAWNGTDGFNVGSDFYTYLSIGQTIRVPGPADVILSDFSFRFGNDYIWSPLSSIRAYVMAWNEVTGSAVGPVLYQSDPRHVPFGPPSFTVFDYQPAVQLAGGQSYALFATATKESFTTSNWIEAGAIIRPATDPYVPGSMIYQFTAFDFNNVYQPWSVFREADLAFTAELDPAVSAVPAPSGSVLLALGSLTVVLFEVARRSAPRG